MNIVRRRNRGLGREEERGEVVRVDEGGAGMEDDEGYGC